MHVQLQTFTATAAAAAGSAAAAATGDSLQVQNGQKAVRILAIWSQLQTTGFIRVTGPTQHDQLTGWTASVPAGQIQVENPLGIDWQVRPQEILAVTIAENAVAGDIGSVCMLQQFDDLPGVEGRYMKFADVAKRVGRLVTVRGTITAGAGGGYTGEELISAESDNLKPNQDYAVLGLTTSVACAAVTLRGPDLGNVRIGVPGDPNDHDLSSQFFCMLSKVYDLPLIPIINSGNRASTFVGCVQNENAAAVPYTLHLGLLS